MFIITTKDSFKFLFCILLLSFVLGCQTKSTKQPKIIDKTGFHDTLQRINKFLVKQDAERIASYVKRHNWHMTQTKTGLWYEIYKKGTGAKATKGQIASFNYSIELLDGTKCYSSDSLGVKKMNIGRGNVESGLEEGLLFMQVGDKAHFIMPPHLAHGLLGDFDKIPTRASLVYDVELVNLLDF